MYVTSCAGVVDCSLAFVWWGVDSVDVVGGSGGDSNEDDGDDNNCCVGTTYTDCIPGGGIGCSVAPAETEVVVVVGWLSWGQARGTVGGGASATPPPPDEMLVVEDDNEKSTSPSSLSLQL